MMPRLIARSRLVKGSPKIQWQLNSDEAEKNIPEDSYLIAWMETLPGMFNLWNLSFEIRTPTDFVTHLKITGLHNWFLLLITGEEIETTEKLSETLYDFIEEIKKGDSNEQSGF